jgi:RNA polymerase sigma-70 factor (ECF subfamily)
MSAAGTISLNTESSDERLVAAAKTGHRGAFDELFKRYAQIMFRTARRVTRNREDAEDAVQECFLNAFIHLRSFDGRSRFSTWLTRIAVNAALMKLRKVRGSREVSLEEQIETNELQPQRRVTKSSLNPEQSYAESEREAIVRSAVAELRPKIRKVLELHQLQEFSMHETAEVLGISVTAVKARLFHARANLRRASQLQFMAPSSWKNSEAGAQPAR